MPLQGIVTFKSEKLEYLSKFSDRKEYRFYFYLYTGVDFIYIVFNLISTHFETITVGIQQNK